MSSGDKTVEATDPRGERAPLGAGGRVRRGDHVGRYIVVDLLGAGGMGEVFVAFDPDLGRKIALKLLAPDADGYSSGGSDPGGQRRLLREANALAQLSHPNVVAVYDVGTFEGNVFIAMELVDGATLRAWLEKVRPSWRAALDVMLAAGEGLAAAHRAGLVHRDFKPDNVMVGKDGRVRVMDFGLARPASAHPPQAKGEELALVSTEIARRRAEEVSQTGALMGTPSYMAPEQHVGAKATPESDQFAFAIVLYEALYGERPFAGATWSELALAVTGGRIKPPRRDRKVPARVERAMLRALEADPVKRWPSMDALLAELARDPMAARRRAVMGAAGALVLGALVVGIVQSRARPDDVCKGAEGRLEGVWDDAARERVKGALARASAPYGAEVSDRVVRGLDAYAARWVASSTDACLATSVRKEQSQEMLDLRSACLAQRRRDLSALVAVLADADGTTVQRAVQAVDALPRIEPCADPAYLRARVPPPDRPETATQVEREREALARERALVAAGRYPEANAATDGALDRAAKIGFRPLEAEAAYAVGETELELGRYPDAIAHLEAAYFAAAGAGHDEIAFEAAKALAYVVGYRQERFAEGEAWARHARAAMERGGAAGTEMEARLDQAISMIDEREGRYDEALALERAALAIYERAPGGPPLAVANVLVSAGIVEDHLGRWDESIASYEKARAIWAAALGPRHPNVAMVDNDQGLALLHARRFDEALALLRDALSIWEEALGPDHVNVSATLTNLADALNGKKEYAAAAEHARRAVALREKALGPDHPRIAEPLTSLGAALLGQGDAKGALAPLERALRLREAGVGDKTELAETRFVLARALFAARGDRARARSLAEQARAAYAAAGLAAREAEVATWLAANAR